MKILNKINKYFISNYFDKLIIRGLGIGDWGLGIGDWGLGPMPHTPNPNPILYPL